MGTSDGRPAIPAERPEILRGNAGEIVLAFTALASVVVLTVYCQKAEAGDLLAALLLVLSTLYSCLIVALSYKAETKPLGRMIWAFAGFEGFKALLLCLYCVYGATPERAAPAIEGFVTWSGFLAVLAVSVTSILLIDRTMEAKGGALAPRIGRLLAVDAFLPLISMGALFLYAAYYLTFAVAFHDLGTGGGALDATVQEGPIQGGKGVESRAPAPGSAGRLNDCFPDPNEILKYRFAFRPGRASLGCARILRGRLGGIDWPELADVLGRLPGSAECAGMTAQDALSTLRAVACVESYLENQEQAHRVRISLVGHAGDDLALPASEGYSRYDLSLARVQQAHFLLSEIHEAANPKIKVEWLLLPVSGEEVFLSAAASPDPETPPAPDLRSSVEVRLQTLNGRPADHLAQERSGPHRLELLDYLYFMTYTITTTGYGDLVPRTPTVKFATAVANLFEVFFLVVAINVLIGCVLDHGRGSAQRPGEC